MNDDENGAGTTEHENNDEEIEEQNEIEDTDHPIKNRSKKKTLSIVFKFLIIGIIISAAFYLIYFRGDHGRVNFLLSDTEIEYTDDNEIQNKFQVNDRVYFYINRSGSSLNANIFSIEIEVFKDKSYNHYKQISYEIDKDFPKIESFIPQEYFRHKGKYRIKAYLDSNIVSHVDIDVE